MALGEVVHGDDDVEAPNAAIIMEVGRSAGRVREEGLVGPAKLIEDLRDDFFLIFLTISPCYIEFWQSPSLGTTPPPPPDRDIAHSAVLLCTKAV